MPDKKNPYSLKEIFEQMTMDLIRSMKRNFVRHAKEELKEGFQWEQWQLVKLRNMQKYRKENQDIIGSYSQEIEDTVNQVLLNSFDKGTSNVERSIKKSGIKAPIGEISIPGEIKIPTNNVVPNPTQEIPENQQDIIDEAEKLPKTPREENFFGMNTKKLKALQDTVQNDMKKASHAVQRKMDDVYRQVIYKAEMNMAAGAKTLNQAIDMATKDFLASGINCIEYKNGRKVNVASYAEMALRTASQRATFLGEGQKRNEWGIYTIVVSAHASACDMCILWQGKILIDDVFSNGTREHGDYPLLSEAIKAGLLHPNCRHTLATYFPGITKLPKIPNEKTAKKNYGAEQRQRYLERNIRKWKRIQEGSLDETNINFAKGKVKEWQYAMREHMKNNSQLRRDYEREKVRVPLKKPSASGTMNLIKHKVLGSKENVPAKAEPNSVLDKLSSKNNVISRTIYDQEGKMGTQINPTNHGNPKTHPFGEKGEHAHDVIWDGDKVVGRTRRELTPQEREIHKDILE